MKISPIHRVLYAFKASQPLKPLTEEEKKKPEPKDEKKVETKDTFEKGKVIKEDKK